MEFLEEDEQIWLATLYDKGEASDLTAEQKRAMSLAVAREKAARRGHRNGR